MKHKNQSFVMVDFISLKDFYFLIYFFFRKEVLEHFSDTQASSGGTSSRQVEDAPPSYDDYLKSLESGVY